LASENNFSGIFWKEGFLCHAVHIPCKRTFIVPLTLVQINKRLLGTFKSVIVQNCCCWILFNRSNDW